MSKHAKHRACPAVAREITSAECGANRLSQYRCPPECVFNPFAPMNYQKLLEIESVVDEACLQWLANDAQDKRALARDMQKVIDAGSPHNPHAFCTWHLFCKQDSAGLTSTERWERAGFKGLGNDEQALIRAKMQTRVALLEIHRVLDGERTEVVDLLLPRPEPIIVLDRSFAGTGLRFATCIAWLYPMPHYWRLSGTAIVLPELGQFEPGEIVTEIVRHLGGPSDEAGLRRWLAEHFVRFDDALHAVSLARQEKSLAAMDIEWCNASYTLQCPAKECLGALDTVPAVELEPPSPAEQKEGFTSGRVWFEEEGETLWPAPGGRVVLGQVLVGRSQCRLVAIGRARLTKLRKRFEPLLRNRVQFVSEVREDVASRLAVNRPQFDVALVPPRLLQETAALIVGSSRLALPVKSKALRGRTPRDMHLDLLAAHDRTFPDEKIPALDGRTPRQAAGDPAVRPKLIRILKQRVRQCDEDNLATGRRDDVNWLLRELGLTEILFDPPPPRPPPPRVPDEPAAARLQPGPSPHHLPPAPPLPEEPISSEDALARIRAGIRPFTLARDGIEALHASGSTILDDAHELLEDSLTEREFAFLVPVLLQLWFAVVPPGTRAPVLSVDCIASGFNLQREAFNQLVSHPDEQNMSTYFRSSSQPALAKAIFVSLISSEPHAPTDLGPSRPAQGIMISFLMALLNELNRVLRPPRTFEG
jgi:hypothetical protein